MRKYLIVLFLCFFSMFFINCLAQEQLTITTYYPSPVGSYNELTANKLAIGLNNSAATLGNGVLDFTPLNANPAGNEGSVYYNSVTHGLKIFDGTSWKDVKTSYPLVPYSQGGGLGTPTFVTVCPETGTHVVAVFTNTKRGADLSTPPTGGFMICI
jgi:hypothetical protein